MLPLLTWSFDAGVVVPIPTLVSAVALLTPLMLPNTSELFWATMAFAPMAVAFNRDVPKRIAFDLFPISVIDAPFVVPSPALAPTKVFRDPPPLLFPAKYPTKALSEPVVLNAPAL